MNKIMFLDLEETLVKSWHDPVFCNTDLIKEILAVEEIKKVHMFSFAINDDSDKKIFEERFKKPLEKHFDIDIMSWMSIDEIMKEVFQFNGIAFEKFEFTTMWGKLKAFHDFCRNKFKDTECVLIDDVVPNSTFELTDKNLIIRTIHVP